VLTATDIAEAVRSGARTASAVTEDALDRIAQRDSTIGAFQVVRAERVLAEADAVDARTDRHTLPLAGVPIAIKDNVPCGASRCATGRAVATVVHNRPITRW